MFQSDKSNAKQMPKRGRLPQDSTVTILTSGCHFDGKLYCRGSSRIGGKVEGQIVSEGLLVIEEEAQIRAEIKADEAVIQGQVIGKLEAGVRVELCSTSRFTGDLMSPVLIIDEGALFNGRASMPDHARDRADEKVRAIDGAAHGAHEKRPPSVDAAADKSVVKMPDVSVK